MISMSFTMLLVAISKRKEQNFWQKSLKLKKGLNKKFAKSLILLVGREGIEPSRTELLPFNFSMLSGHFFTYNYRVL